jgi:predicted AlkP superfamily pyrophosphatase or phosphodiesterase
MTARREARGSGFEVRGSLMKKLALAVVLLVTVRSTGAPVRAQASRPKLVVFLVVDQMRADYPVRYGGLLQHGLKRLTTQGAWYTHAAYPYLTTVTCVGHTTIGTGTLPYKHGMIANAWYDRATSKVVTCNSDPETTDVSYAAGTGTGDSAKNMMVPTLAEVMRDALKSRVATMSMKARSAIGLAGHKGDFVTWFGDRNAWETSSAFTKAPVGWFVGYLKGNPAERDAGKTWERTLPAERYQDADDAPGERGAGGWNAKFPHPLGAAGDAAYYAHLMQSPYLDEQLETMAEAAVDEMHLGTGGRTDFLGVSFSSLDSVGHSYGPRSHEIQDMLVRLDITLGKLLDYLDKKVGAGNYVVAMGSDHGVADLPEQNPAGGRQPVAAVRTAIESAMRPGLGGDGAYVTAISGGDVYFKPGVYERLKADPATLKAVMAAATALPGVARVFPSDEISTPAARASTDSQTRAAALSYFAGRSGDLTVLVKENWIMTAAGTTHGTLYDYDQRVPVILYGAGIKPGVREEPATPADLAVTVASLVGVQLPSPDGHVLTGALKTP